MEITYYGHSCFGVKLKTHSLLFDPFITGNLLAKEIDVKKIKADFILVSHAHYDHMADVMQIAEQNGSVVISNYEIVKWFGKNGLKGGIGMNPGKTKTDFGTLRLVSAIHSSSFSGDRAYGGNPGGFVIESDEGNFYFAGDTALTWDMKLIPMFCSLKFAMLPIGGHFTMDFNDAILASDFIECNNIIGMHYDSFPPIKINHAEAIAAFKAKGKELVLLNIGDSLAL